MLFCFCLYIHLYFVLSPPCEPKWDEAEVKHIIENIEGKMFINKIESFYCEYKILSEVNYIANRLKGQPNEVKHYIKDYEIAWIGNIGNQHYFYHSICQNYSKPSKLPLSPSTPLQQKISKFPGSLFELLKSKLEEEELRYYQYVQSKPTKSENPILLCSTYIVYNKKPYLFSYEWYNDENFKVRKNDSEDSYPAGVLLFRYLGQIGYRESQLYTCNFGESLVSFLKTSGPYYISKEGEYLKLWHYRKDNTDKLPVELEIWLDKDYKIFRIDNVRYASRSFSQDSFNRGKYNGPIDCNTPKWIYERIQIDEYFHYGDALYLPIKAFYEAYILDYDNELAREIEMAHQEGKMGTAEYFFASTQIPAKVNSRDELTIDKESIRINELTPDFFKPPKEIVQESDIKRNPHVNIIIFVSICIVCILIAMFVTRRYLGWGL